MRRGLLACLVLVTACGGAEAPRDLPPATGPATPRAEPLGAPLALGRNDRLHEREGLRLRGPGVPLRGFVLGWAVAPDRRAIALSVSLRGRVQVVRADPLRDGGVAETHAGGPFIAVAWPRRERVLAITGQDPGLPSRLVDVDPAGPRERRERTLDGTAVAAEGGPLGLLAVLGPTGRSGEARLLHADPAGRVRVHRLRGIAAGWDRADPSSGRGLRRSPGLAVSVTDRRAFVVAPTARLRIAEVDLRTGRTAVHDLPEPRSLLARLRDLVEAPAWAKAGDESTRVARWLGDGRLAVSGIDLRMGRAGPPEHRPVGLRLVDVRRWRQQLVDREAAHVVVAGGLLLTGWGYAMPGGGVLVEHRGSGGLRAYDHHGRRRWVVRPDRALTARYEHDGRLFAYDWRAQRMLPVDPATGRVGVPLRPGRVPVSLSSLP